MLRASMIVVLLLILSSCGGTRYSNQNAANSRTNPATQPVLFATGPISSACLAAGRRDASRVRCGCVQAVANMSLSASDQRRGIVFFDDPQRAQDTRQADGASNEAFWQRWKAFGTDAERLCT